LQSFFQHEVNMYVFQPNEIFQNRPVILTLYKIVHVHVDVLPPPNHRKYLRGISSSYRILSDSDNIDSIYYR